MTEPGSTPAAVTSPGAADEVDPQLLALPAPPTARAIAGAGLMVGVIALSVLLMWTFLGDLRYFLSGYGDSGSAPLDLGDVQALGSLPENRFVTVRGLPRAASAIRFRRFVRGGTYRVYPMMGQPLLFVQSFIADGTRIGRRPRHGEYSGRLISFANARGGYDAVRAFFRRELGVEVPENAYLLMDGESPAEYGWVVALYLLLLLFLVTSAILFYRHVRPVPVED